MTTRAERRTTTRCRSGWCLVIRSSEVGTSSRHGFELAMGCFHCWNSILWTAASGGGGKTTVSSVVGVPYSSTDRGPLTLWGHTFRDGDYACLCDNSWWDRVECFDRFWKMCGDCQIRRFIPSIFCYVFMGYFRFAGTLNYLLILRYSAYPRYFAISCHCSADSIAIHTQRHLRRSVSCEVCLDVLPD